jgi:hypothetical protein
MCQKFKDRAVSSISIAKAVLKKDHKKTAMYRKINAIIDGSELKETYGLDETKCSTICS